MDTVVLDIDGTLLDSNYHHALAWARAFDHVGIEVPLWRIHRSIGMGGDRLVAEVAGDDVEQRAGDALRERWVQEFDRVADETRPFPGARELLSELGRRGLNVVLASSGNPRHAARAQDLLHAETHADAATSSEDAEESKPDPELIQEALARVDGVEAVIVGDSVWDVLAANEARLPTIGVLCGGYSSAELLEAGAAAVYRDPADLLENLDQALEQVAGAGPLR